MIKLLLSLMLASGIAAAAQRTVVLTWKSGNVGTAKLPTCSQATPKKCVYGFTLKMDGIQIAGPAKLGVLAVVYTQTTLPKTGSHLYSLVMNGYDVVGNASASKPATTTIYVPPPTVIPLATSFKAVFK